jgi:hypothetical protein
MAAARRLRASGKTYNDIHRRLGIPKSTLSLWFRDLRLSRAARKQLMTQNQQRWAESIIRYNKWRAKQAQDQSASAKDRAAKEIGSLTARELMLVGAALYWAEGGKFDRWRLHFCNSDPDMITLALRFFRVTCRVHPEKLIARIHLHPHVSEQRAKRFWSRVSGIPLDQFQRSQRVLSRSSRGKRPMRRLPYGTLHITVQDAVTRNRVMGWIAGLQQSSNGTHPS